MANPGGNALLLQREIAERRQDLAITLERLRDTIRLRVAAGRQLRDRVLTAALIGGALLSIAWLGARAIAARSQRPRGGWLASLLR